MKVTITQVDMWGYWKTNNPRNDKENKLIEVTEGENEWISSTLNEFAKMQMFLIRKWRDIS